MKPESRTLSFALGFSLLLHSLPLVPALLPQKTPPPPPQPPVLTARLEAAPQPELQFKEVQSKAAADPPAPKNKVLSSTVGTGKPSSARDAVKQAQAQIASKLLYPPEAVRRGFEVIIQDRLVVESDSQSRQRFPR